MGSWEVYSEDRYVEDKRYNKEGGEKNETGKRILRFLNGKFSLFK